MRFLDVCFCDDEMMSKSHIQQREREREKKGKQKREKKSRKRLGPVSHRREHTGERVHHQFLEK